MTRIDPTMIASTLETTSWMDRLDLTSPSQAERSRAALVIAQSIVERLSGGGEEPVQADDDQLALPM